MLSEAVMELVGDQNPVVVAAQAHGFSTDLDFLEHVAGTKDVPHEVKTSYIDAYAESRDQPRPAIPYFAVRAIEEAFPSKLPEKQAQVHATRDAKHQLQEAEPKKKQPPRQCRPPRR